ncbi:proton/glutamate symport protein [Vibrio astriarenae]|nr:proton/glutamate symport protein [Vibrio sp. C7]
MNTKQPMSLTGRVILGMVTGILTGFFIQSFLADVTFVHEYLVNGLFEVGGQIFISSLQMLVVPLIFVSLVCGTSSLQDITTLGRMGGKTLGFYLVTTAVAITLALTMGTLFQPGAGADLTAAASFQSAEAPSLGQVIINMFPKNPIASMAQGNTLQIIVFAILFGIAISAAGEAGKRIANVFSDLNEVIMKLVALLMNIAPFGVFFLMAKLFSGLGLGAIWSLVATS